MPDRFVEWGHWGLSFWNGNLSDQQSWEAVAKLPFGVGPRGPVDGTLGSPERQRYEAICRAWTERGELPEGACCNIDQAWLYDPSFPGARWVEGYGWQSPARVPGRGWVYPEV